MTALWRKAERCRGSGQGLQCDTNVLIYACDQADSRRQRVALDLIANSTDGVPLWQVACEFLSASRN
jgi:predicted nucleic acid-binding protein